MKSHTHLWLDTVAGLKKQGWVLKGGNFTCFSILEKDGDRIKVYLDDYKKVNQDEINHVVVRYI